jgi:RNA polymerase sigma-70 factor (ECF subfamily)
MSADDCQSEAELIAQAKAGDVEAFEALYRSYSGRVYGLCIRLTSNRAEAEDCTQETFITAWQKLPDFRGESRLMTWLHAIAYHEVVGRQRSSARQANHLTAVAAEAADEDRAGPIERRDLEAAIARLPERAREAFVLQKIYGYTHQEAGEIMSITAGACKAQVHRAVQLLATALQTDEETGGAAANGNG